MPELMTLKAQQDAASAMRSQLSAGVPIADAAARMVRLQPGQGQFWAEAAAQMRTGRPLSSVLGDVWPPAAVSAVRAGEANGGLVEVLENLTKSIALKRRLLKSASRILYPVSMIVSAAAVFIGFLLTIVPTIAQQTMRAGGLGGDPDGVAGFGLRMRVLLMEHWTVTVLALAAVVFGVVVWLRQPQTRSSIVRALLDAPLFGSAFRNMAFGLWADYMALSCGAGLPTIDALANTVEVLPEPLQAGVRALEHDLKFKHVPLDVAADPDKQPAGDPRQQWPFYLAFAFSIGQQTGRVDLELRRVAPEMVEVGESQMEQAISISNLAAIAIAGSLLASTMLLVYLPMLRSLKNLH